jgi:hypothetical protein
MRSVPSKIRWDSWWTKWHRIKFLSEFMRLPLHFLLYSSHHPFRGTRVVELLHPRTLASYLTWYVLGASRKVRSCYPYNLGHAKYQISKSSHYKLTYAFLASATYSARSILFVSLRWRQGLLGKVPRYVRLYPCFPTTVICSATSQAELKANLKSPLIIPVKWNKIQWHLFPGVYTMQVNSYWFPYTCICTPKIMLNYRPNGRRRLGRPLKRLLLDEAETGLSVPDSWRVLTMIMMVMTMYMHSSLTKRK